MMIFMEFMSTCGGAISINGCVAPSKHQVGLCKISHSRGPTSLRVVVYGRSNVIKVLAESEGLYMTCQPFSGAAYVLY